MKRKRGVCYGFRIGQREAKRLISTEQVISYRELKKQLTAWRSDPAKLEGFLDTFIEADYIAPEAKTYASNIFEAVVQAQSGNSELLINLQQNIVDWQVLHGNIELLKKSERNKIKQSIRSEGVVSPSPTPESSIRERLEIFFRSPLPEVVAAPVAIVKEAPPLVSAAAVPELSTPESFILAPPTIARRDGFFKSALPELGVPAVIVQKNPPLSPDLVVAQASPLSPDLAFVASFLNPELPAEIDVQQLQLPSPPPPR